VRIACLACRYIVELIDNLTDVEIAARIRIMKVLCNLHAVPRLS
jgi:hypothetical protein